MKRKRKTAGQLRQERAEADRQAWESFSPALAAVQSVEDVLVLYASAPRPDAPGRRYFANLGFFLQGFSAPDGASATELRQYLRIIGIYDADGLLKEGVRSAIEERLREAISRRQ